MKTVKIKIDPVELSTMNELLKRTTQDPNTKHDHTIQVYTAQFDHGIEADIKVVNGCIDSGPYVDPVLFEHGSEICIGEVGDQLDGEYLFPVDREVYQVLIESE